MRLAATLPAPRIEAGFATLVVAGLAVGIGTSYGSGCTSGHGVCGISRLSPRSEHLSPGSFSASASSFRA